MNALAEHLRMSLRLHFRNWMALIYGYLFPLIFLVAFAVLYRHEKPLLLRHMGELLTIAVLGGACFGLPATLVAERERGVWKRYRLTPVPTWAVVTSTAVARYVIILTAGLLQTGLAMAIGMTAPEHPFDLWLAFTFAAFAFIGIGLVIATLADNVPAVQALGQCIFLPMLVIGGVAVQLASLPAWAQHVSAFFPGRYSVEALQACVTGGGLETARFGMLALVFMGLAGGFAGAKLFRWEERQRFLNRGGTIWIVPVVGVWLAVGLLAEWRGRVMVAAESPVEPADEPATKWTEVDENDIAGLDFNVPPDTGIVTPFASTEDAANDYLAADLAAIRENLFEWPPAYEGDEAQRVRNCLSACAVADALGSPVEAFLPQVMLEYLTETFREDDLIQILVWIVLHPEEGNVVVDISGLGVEGSVGYSSIIRERSYLYAIKFIARLTGRNTEMNAQPPRT
ncbi:MAG: ABC transporter permease [Opitutaceae bacterium]